MSKEKLSELMKRDRKLQAIMGQRELTQAEKDVRPQTAGIYGTNHV